MEWLFVVDLARQLAGEAEAALPGATGVTAVALVLAVVLLVHALRRRRK